MSLFAIFRRGRDTSAQEAKARLREVVARDRQVPTLPDFLPIMQEELLRVIGRYVHLDPQTVHMEIQYGNGHSRLAVNVELPGGRGAMQH